MTEQQQLFPNPAPVPLPPPQPGGESTGPVAPVWLQRMSLIVLVLFCLYIGALVAILPWWPRMWDHNMFILSRPWLRTALHNGAVRGIISGIGVLDIWIGISELIHYRDDRG